MKSTRPLPPPRWIPAALALLLGCGGTTAEDPTRPCTRVGQACKLPKGPLGVCEKGLEAGFVCAPQH